MTDRFEQFLRKLTAAVPDHIEPASRDDWLASKEHELRARRLIDELSELERGGFLARANRGKK